MHLLAKEYGIRPSDFIDESRSLPSGLRWQFDLAVAVAGNKSLRRMDEDSEASSPPPPPSGDRPALLMTERPPRPFTPEDYRTPSDEEIDANLRSLAADERFGGAVEWVRE